MIATETLQYFRRWRLARRGVFVDRSCRIGVRVCVGASMPGKGAIEIGTRCELGNGVDLDSWGGRIVIGAHVFLGPYVVIYGHGGVDIGEHSLIAMHCCIVAANHTVPDRGRLIRDEPDIPRPITIGRDVWLGSAVKVLGGVSIGDGCVVGAGAVVTRSLPPYSIAMGVPARVVGERR